MRPGSSLVSAPTPEGFRNQAALEQNNPDTHHHFCRSAQTRRKSGNEYVSRAETIVSNRHRSCHCRKDVLFQSIQLAKVIVARQRSQRPALAVRAA